MERLTHAVLIRAARLTRATLTWACRRSVTSAMYLQAAGVDAERLERQSRPLDRS